MEEFSKELKIQMKLKIPHLKESDVLKKSFNKHNYGEQNTNRN